MTPPVAAGRSPADPPHRASVADGGFDAVMRAATRSRGRSRPEERPPFPGRGGRDDALAAAHSASLQPVTSNASQAACGVRDRVAEDAVSGGNAGALAGGGGDGGAVEEAGQSGCGERASSTAVASAQALEATGVISTRTSPDVSSDVTVESGPSPATSLASPVGATVPHDDPESAGESGGDAGKVPHSGPPVPAGVAEPAGHVDHVDAVADKDAATDAAVIAPTGIERETTGTSPSSIEIHTAESLENPAQDGTLGTGDSSDTASPAAAASTTAPPGSTAPVDGQAAARAPVGARAVERVMALIEQLQASPPPKTITVDLQELGGARVVVSLRGQSVTVLPVGNQTLDSGFTSDLSQGLAERGLNLAGDGSTGHRGGHAHDDDPGRPQPHTRDGRGGVLGPRRAGSPAIRL